MCVTFSSMDNRIDVQKWGIGLALYYLCLVIGQTVSIICICNCLSYLLILPSGKCLATDWSVSQLVSQ